MSKGKAPQRRAGIVKSLAEFAQITGRTEAICRGWIRKGMPVEKRGTRGEAHQIDSAAALDWLIQDRLTAALGGGNTDIDEARRRKIAAEAEIAELNLAERRGEVAPVDMFQTIWERRVAGARARLLAIPVKAAPQVVGEDMPAIQECLQELIYEALTELADSKAE